MFNWLRDLRSNKQPTLDGQIKEYERLIEIKSYDIQYKIKKNEVTCLIYDPRGGMRLSFGVVANTKFEAIRDAYRVIYHKNRVGIRWVNNAE